MKMIPVGHTVAIVDDVDYEALAIFRWSLTNKGRAVRNAKRDGKWRPVQMHLDICPKKPGFEIDHINGDPLDNRRGNLRYVVRWQNNANARKRKDSRYKYKGIAQRAGRDNWYARIKVHGKEVYIGTYETDVEAAVAYNDAAKKYFGEYARLNQFERGEDA